MNHDNIIENATAEELRAAVYAMAKAHKYALQIAMDAISDLRFAAARQDALRLISAAGEHGLTQREIFQGSRRFKSLPEDERQDVLDDLQCAGFITMRTFRPDSGRGLPRKAWVALDKAG